MTCSDPASTQSQPSLNSSVTVWVPGELPLLGRVVLLLINRSFYLDISELSVLKWLQTAKHIGYKHPQETERV